MVKLVDTSDLKSAAAGRAGSIPARGTILIKGLLANANANPCLFRLRQWLSVASLLLFFISVDVCLASIDAVRVADIDQSSFQQNGLQCLAV